MQGTANTTRKILERKKRTDTQYDNTASFDGQRFGKLKVATLVLNNTKKWK